MVHHCHRRKSPRPSRSAAAILEAAIILPVVLLTLLVMLDCGLAVARQHRLAACAQTAARWAIVHGEKSDAPLGPGGWSGTLAESYPLCELLRRGLHCLAPQEVQLQAVWPDGGRQPGQRVQITLSVLHKSLLINLLGDWELSARSTMRIVH